MPEATQTQSQPARARSRYGVPGWAIVLLVVALGLMVAGIAIPALGAGGQASPPPRSPATNLPPGESHPPGVTPLVEPGRAAEPGAPAESTETPFSPALFRLGFSFFVAFAIAYALRSFFSFAIVAIGFFFLALFGLQYAGIIDVHWGRVEERYDTLAAWLSAQTRSFGAFINGYLPSAGSAAVGMLAGFRRRG